MCSLALGESGQMRDPFPGLESGVVLGLTPVWCLPGCAYLA